MRKDLVGINTQDYHTYYSMCTTYKMHCLKAWMGDAIFEYVNFLYLPEGIEIDSPDN